MTDVESFEAGREPTRALSSEECWDLLASADYGRVVTTAAGEIDVFTVNHRVSDGTILFRTSAGTKLLELTIHSDVVFRVDGRDDTMAFSVVVKGVAVELQSAAELEVVDGVDLLPWAPEDKDRWVRISPAHVSGRAFRPAR